MDSYLSRLSESHANSMFNFLRNPQSHSTVAESFYSPISSMRGFRCFHIHDNSGSFPFFCNFNSHPSRCKVLSRVLICISLMPNDTEYFFLCLFTMSLPSLEKYLFHSHTHFLIELFIFVHVCLLHWKSPFHILDTRFTNMWFANIFPHSRVCIFTLLIMSFYSLLPCCETCGILVPQPGIKPVPLWAWAWSPNHWTAGEVPG